MFNSKFFVRFLQKLLDMDYKAVIERLQEALSAKNQSDLAKKLGMGSGNAVKNWQERGSVDLNKIFAADPSIDLNWLFYGTEKTHIKTGVPLIPVDAVAGYGTPAYSDLPVEDYYTVSEFKHADFLIRVSGDSMTPKYKSGDIVACRRVIERNFWQWHTIYVIATRNQGVLIKRVEESTIPGCVTCVSENPAYRPFQVPLDEIVSVALVMGAIVLE